MSIDYLQFRIRIGSFDQNLLKRRIRYNKVETISTMKMMFVLLCIFASASFSHMALSEPSYPATEEPYSTLHQTITSQSLFSNNDSDLVFTQTFSTPECYRIRPTVLQTYKHYTYIIEVSAFIVSPITSTTKTFLGNKWAHYHFGNTKKSLPRVWFKRDLKQ